MKMILLSLATVLASFAQQPAAVDFAGSLNSQYQTNRGYLLASAEMWPADAYTWRPAGRESELRTFGQLIAHIANENFMVCSRVQNQPVPAKLDDTKGVFPKPEAIRLLKESFAACDSIYSALTNASIEETVTLSGRNKTTSRSPRGTRLVANVAHSNEQYGIIMVYFALRNMAPPSHAGKGN